MPPTRFDLDAGTSSGSARVSRVGDRVSRSWTLKDCFGETPKPTRETRALPGHVEHPVLEQRCAGGAADNIRVRDYRRLQ
jgi:hypothetical protein